MSILDQFGNPIERERVRRALGFVERTVKADDGDVAHGVAPNRARQSFPGYRSNGDGWWTVPHWCVRDGEPR